MTNHVEVAIIGGGVAGLWTANQLKSAGYSVALFSKGDLGDGQSLAAQGVIHGGSKYALAGKLTDSSEQLAAMPDRWRDALAGVGSVKIEKAKVLSDHQVLWSLPSVTSQVVSFFGSKLMRGRSDAIAKQDWPLALPASQYKGKVFRIDEPVLDPITVIEGLYKGVSENCYQGRCEVIGNESKINKLQIGDVEITADHYVLAAGEGNGALLKSIGIEQPAMQVRPLHQVIIKGDLPDFYSVCIGNGAKPPIVTTTHQDRDGNQLWWIGGDIAEAKGVARSEEDQIEHARQSMQSYLPWIDWSAYEFSTARANRAEPLTGTGDRPAGAYCQQINNLFVTWPTKLALAPNLADKVAAQLPEPKGGATAIHFPLPRPQVGNPPWF